LLDWVVYNGCAAALNGKGNTYDGQNDDSPPPPARSIMSAACMILGIESSCDETSAAVVLDGREVRSNVVSSQVALHAKYGGVVPEIAARAHIERRPEWDTPISTRSR
jgi:hypothetical protein